MLELLTRHLPGSLRSRSGRLIFLCLAGSICLVLVSIAASQILLAGAIAGCLWERLRNPAAERRIATVVWPLLCFLIWTVAAMMLSPDVLLALGELKKFFLYLILFLTPAIAGAAGTRAWIYRGIFGMAAVSATAGLIQYLANPNRDLLHRISGLLSHWMTFSGTLMLVLVALFSYVLCYGLRRSWWAVPVGILTAVATFLSQTRNALLVGGPAGLIAVFLLMKRYRAIAGLAVVLAVTYVASPAGIRQRLRVAFDRSNPDTSNRIELFETATRLIRDNPWFGVGPKNVGIEALRYRGNRDYPEWMYQHMHNNFLQIAAERGIPGLILWLWLMIRLAWDSWKRYCEARRRMLEQTERGDTPEALMVSTAALGAWIALLGAGMFEYNFGDSEVLTLFAFMMSAPYADPVVEPAGAA